MTDTTIRERLAWEVTPELYGRIRHLWIDHSKAEDRRNGQGLIPGAFPDVTFDLRDIVIGPQGVIEIATMRGTQRGTWQRLSASGRRVELDVVRP